MGLNLMVDPYEKLETILYLRVNLHVPWEIIASSFRGRLACDDDKGLGPVLVWVEW